ncbi:acyl-CoA dehydrogenase family protein [Pseudoalteromonas luteoviolacea]|uniref:Acyl-CoA dehydrogenase n=1 Tax=Pseudoalteromonas luteoviolacea H33 TaxID=1365251 RepID=A0A166ZQM3_9GAMM|nr:acyl-CoA dehydrogenase family protein [Pseudoalteromonas luteoviolacea]KZN44558.1 hypothetical protein N476_06045 [Pseudoalteromonas luteoviolacea H33]KZN75360.1 hypothetical protein N477_19055 [Pseudoalteromonas luteoviolacea H33-S]
MSDGIYFNQSHKNFRTEVRKFLHQHAVPNIDRWESERKVDRAFWQALGQTGWLGIAMDSTSQPQESSWDIFHGMIFIEELGRLGSAGLRTAIAVHSHMTLPYLTKLADVHTREVYLHSAIRGEKVAALALTEPDAGTDLNALKLNAQAQADGFVLNGHKQFVANGTECDFFVVLARTSEATQSRFGATGLSLFVVDAHAPGVHRTPLNCLGWHSADVAELKLEQVFVPKSHVIGKVGQGFQLIVKGMQLERLSAGVMALAANRCCLEQTWHHLKSRQLGGASVSKYQVVRHAMARLSTQQASIEQLAYHCAWSFEQGKMPMKEIAMLKVAATELHQEIVTQCAQFHGAQGYVDSHIFARFVRDSHVVKIAAGANEAMNDLIAQALENNPNMDL